MTIDASTGLFIALGLVIAAWVGKANLPPAVANAAGWVFAVAGTLLLMYAALR